MAKRVRLYLEQDKKRPGQYIGRATAIDEGQFQYPNVRGKVVLFTPQLQQFFQQLVANKNKRYTVSIQDFYEYKKSVLVIKETERYLVADLDEKLLEWYHKEQEYLDNYRRSIETWKRRQEEQRRKYEQAPKLHFSFALIPYTIHDIYRLITLSPFLTMKFSKSYYEPWLRVRFAAPFMPTIEIELHIACSTNKYMAKATDMDATMGFKWR